MYLDFYCNFEVFLEQDFRCKLVWAHPSPTPPPETLASCLTPPKLYLDGGVVYPIQYSHVRPPQNSDATIIHPPKGISTHHCFDKLIDQWCSTLLFERNKSFILKCILQTKSKRLISVIFHKNKRKKCCIKLKSNTFVVLEPVYRHGRTTLFRLPAV